MPDSVNWPALAAPVAETLFGGKPTAQRFGEIRYGRKGSLAIDTRAGTWTDFESGESGGILDLVGREIGGERRDAITWLQQRGFLARDDTDPVRGTHGARSRGENKAVQATKAAAGGVKPRVAPPRTDTRRASATRETARHILERCGSALDTPAERYLVTRAVWPPAERAPPVRWIHRAAFPGRLPDGAAGALVFPLTAAHGRADACHIEALDEMGHRVPHRTENRYRRSFGGTKGRVFIGNVPTRATPPVVIIAEGPLDALAAFWLQDRVNALCLATVGTLDKCPLWPLVPGVDVVIEADGDTAGKRASLLRARLQANGRAAAVRHRAQGDPADDLAAAIARQGWPRFLEKDAT
ncbi:MAG: hypothetical protein OXE84_02965 [Rhodobacteraceae bacterium]|nr:hypothetical protein [Paracoccaceae bacterium]MCY4326901.1 hypothetical protein [Paracoccaceae bacterium]